jgi:hypothetical protein
LLLFGLGCQKEDLGTETTFALQGVLKEGLVVEGIKVSSLKSVDGLIAEEPIGDADVVISHNGTQYPLTYDPAVGTYYDATATLDVLPENTYSIEVVKDDEVLTSEAVIPPNVELVFTSEQVIPIDPDTGGEPIFSAIWSPIEGHVFVLALENTEDDPVEIPFTNGGGSFDTFFQFPLDVTGVTIFDNDFTYYGTHRLTVFAISTEYESVFYYSPSSLRENLQNGPDNVLGGAGYFAGASNTVITLELE